MGRGAVIAAITLVLGCVASAYILHPFTPEFVQDGLDASWISVMSAEADLPARWGVDLAFTYGPATPLVANAYNAAYFTRTLPLLIAFALLFGWSAALLIARPGRSLGRAALCTLASIAAVVGARDSADAFFLTLPFLVFLLDATAERPREARRAAALVGAWAMGLTAMAKMSYPLAAVSLFVIADIASVARRRPPILLAACAVGVVSADLLYGQRLSDLPAYVALQGEVVSGYAAAMTLVGPVWDLALFLALSAGLVAAAWWAARRGPGAARIVPLGIAVDFFFLFKAGFIRHDLHALTAWRGLVLVGVTAAVGWFLPRHRRVALGTMVAAAVVAFVYAPVYEVRQSGQRPRAAAFARLYAGWLVDGPSAEGAAALALLRDPAALRSSLDAQAAEARAEIVAANPLGALPGTVDILPSMQSRVLAAGLDYRPRPSFQEYSTYTEGLAQANRAFLEGPRAPDWILFGPEMPYGWMSIDGRYPNLAEGVLWPDLLRLYRPDHRIDALLALRRRAEPVALPFGPPRVVTTGFGAEVPVAADPDDAVWATLDVRPNLLGRIASLLFRPPLPGLAVRFEDGETRWFRFVPALGRAGFILSPVVFNATDFAGLAQGRAAEPRRRVVAVSIQASRATAAFYDPDIRFSFARIGTSALRGGADEPASDPAGSAWDRLAASRPGIGLDQGVRVAAPAPSLIALPAEGLGHLALSYGIEDGAWQDARTTGACFAVYPSDGKRSSLWHACLDPLERPEDRGPHDVSLDVPPGTTELALETTCRGPCGAGWAYWSKPETDAAAEPR